MKKDKQETIPKILKKLAQLLGTEVKNRRLEIPEKFGKGYCTGFIFNEHIRMIISNYELNEDLVVEYPEVNASKRMIFFKFQNIFPKTEIASTDKHLMEMPSVLVATSSLNTDDVISIHTNTAVINIEVDADYLNELFAFSEKSPVLQSLLENAQPLLFEQIIYPSLQKIVDEIVTESVDETFKLFFLRIKAEELVCRLLMELEKRDEKQLYALNTHDIQTIYKVKEKMLEQLEIPPVIGELAMGANMSPSKLKRLFKQVFGNSIFSYYQEFRMKEASRLLKEEKLTVSDVGYKLGFTNLSHFAKVFNEHIGMKPKQYSRF
ncbi:helix-turn-helix transcriptional regulator [Flavobacterium gilvum]|uniref:AraC family transcriptional regulator n=1 Tax=Flavobacterium gilvum TaxID=1492737 RepID=A0AAC9I3G8_9FLAO|nr:AraC family transcriptional regulator [Flavobacterium gilvum]AOW09335.1 AraC family transcriptional regulator [Flavobacterium gilvum]KFC58943.1 transcriptional regulator [Flavobacterium gilvum]